MSEIFEAFWIGFLYLCELGIVIIAISLFYHYIKEFIKAKHGTARNRRQR